MKAVHTEIEINNCTERVWQVLTCFGAYSFWNPCIRRAVGELKTGARLDIYVRLFAGREWRLRTTIVTVEPNRELRWKGCLFWPALFEGEHTFIIEPLAGGGVRFVQREVYTGIFAPVLARILAVRNRALFDEMNRALKEVAERM